MGTCACGRAVPSPIPPGSQCQGEHSPGKGWAGTARSQWSWLCRGFPVLLELWDGPRASVGWGMAEVGDEVWGVVTDLGENWWGEG